MSPFENASYASMTCVASPVPGGVLRDDVEAVGELLHDPVLQVEELGHRAVDLHRREDLARSRPRSPAP